MKRIIFIINSDYPYRTGGRETWLNAITERLTNQGYAIKIIARKSNHCREKIFSEYGVRIHCIPWLDSQLVKSTTIKSLLYLVNSIFFSIGAFFNLIYIYLQGDYDNTVVLTMNPGFETIPALVMNKISKCPVICSVRGNWSFELEYKIRSVSKNTRLQKISTYFLKSFEDLTLNYSTMVIANGYDTYNRLNTNLKRPLVILPNGVDIKKFEGISLDQKRKAVYNISSIASLRDIKGIPQIIQAIPYVVKCRPDVKFLFIGKGDKKRYMETIVKLNAEEYVEFYGERKDIANILSQSDIVLCLSGGSGISHSLLEAMAAGKYIVAWDTPVYSQIIDNNISGILVEENNPQDLASAIIELLEHQDRYSNLPINARRIAQKYDWDRIVAQLVDVIDELPRPSA